MEKQTKIIATIGPACDSKEMIEKLIAAGVNVFRFNFKHNTIQWHNDRIQRVKSVAAKMGRYVGTLIDLQGPEIRINMPYDQLSVVSGQLLVFGEESFEKNQKGFSISHPQIIRHLKPGQKIIADDGAFSFRIEKSQGKIFLRSETSGILKNRKSLNVPGADFPFPVMIDRDFEGLKLALRNELDFIALSFVRTAKDIEILRREMKKYHVDALIVAKIETKKALDHLNSIMNVSDAIMVARGDLGVELPIEEVPYFQKIIIKEAIRKGLPVITATQMLDSMTENPYPTRAEVSDIANAVYDLTDSVMLSGETAIGRYPVETVTVMKKTVQFNETKNKVDSRVRFQFDLLDNVDRLCDTAYGLYVSLRTNKRFGGFLVFTETGKTVRLLSRYRPLFPIFASTPSEKIASSLTGSFGVVPFHFKVGSHKEILAEDIQTSLKYLKKIGYVEPQQIIIALHGDYWGKENSTSTVSLVTVS